MIEKLALSSSGKFARTVVFATFALFLTGQTVRPDDEGAILKRALSLSDSQFVQVQEGRKSASLGAFILNNSQKAKLAAITRILPRWQMASAAIVRGVIDAPAWPGATLCFSPDVPDLLQGEIGLTRAQRLQVNDLVQNRVKKTESPSLRERVLDLLIVSQKTKLAGFEFSLRLAGEAVRFGLIPQPEGGEISCN